MPLSAIPRPTWLLPVLAAAATVLLWASAFVGVRAAGHDFSPGALALGRQLAAAAVLTVVVAVRAVRRPRRFRRPGGRLLAAIALWGAAWFGLYNVALNAAERHLDAGTTALLVNVAPVLAAVLAGLLLGEGFPTRLLAGIGVAFTGVVLIAATTWTGTGEVAGVLLGLLAAVAYAASAVGQKPLLARVDALTMTWLGCLVGALVTLPNAADLVVETAAAGAPATLGVVYLGAFPTAVGFLAWGYALSRTTAGRMVTATYAVPPLVVLMSWGLLGEVPATLALVGGALCLLGVVVATVGPLRRRRRSGPDAMVPTDGPSKKAIRVSH